MKKYVITGMIISLSLMTALTGCGKQAQAETTPPTTLAIETTVAETITAIETTKATKSFTEEQSILFEAITRVWGIKSDEEKVALGRGGLIGLIKESFLDYTDSEYEKMADNILSQFPIPEIKETVEDTKADNTKADNKSNTSSSTKAETNTSNTPQPTEPAPEPQPTQAPETQTGVNDWNEGDWKANLSESDRAIIEGLENSAKDVDVLDNSNLGKGDFGYDGSGDINLGGGM